MGFSSCCHITVAKLPRKWFAVVISNVEYKIYVMYDYFAAGNFREGFRALDSLMSGKNVEEEAIGIAGYFVRCLKNTLYAHDALKKGLSAADIAAHLKISEWSVKSVCAMLDLQKGTAFGRHIGFFKCTDETHYRRRNRPASAE